MKVLKTDFSDGGAQISHQGKVRQKLSSASVNKKKSHHL
jgi:hypothetical protein